MSKEKKPSFKAGDEVVTSARYAKIMHNAAPVSGTLLRETGNPGVWNVELHGFTRPQQLHESMMEPRP